MELVRLISIVALVANAAFADVNLLHLRSRAQANQNQITPPGSSVQSKQAFAKSNINSMDAGQLRALLQEIISHSSETCLDEATSSASSSVTLLEAKAKAKAQRDPLPGELPVCQLVSVPADCGSGNEAINPAPNSVCVDGKTVTQSTPWCCCPPPPPPSSCFSAETNVTMADGSMKRIASLRAGERVRTVDGTATVVLAEQRETGGRNLFGFNHGIPFFTEEHILITKKGPRALNPLALAKEDPSYQGVSELVVGDELINPQGESVVIESIESAEKPFNTPVYNILLDTAHTYFANGYLVSDLFPRLDKFPFTFKLLHWLWRERSSQVDNFFVNILGRDGAATELPTIHQDAEFAELFGRIKKTIDTFVEERS